MTAFTYTITHPQGLHARPAGLLVELVKEMDCHVTITKGDKSAPGERLMALMLLAIGQGDTITVSVDGPLAQQQSDRLKDFFQARL